MRSFQALIGVCLLITALNAAPLEKTVHDDKDRQLLLQRENVDENDKSKETGEVRLVRSIMDDRTDWPTELDDGFAPSSTKQKYKNQDPKRIELKRKLRGQKVVLNHRRVLKDKSEHAQFERRRTRQAGVLDNGSDWESEPEGFEKRRKRQAGVLDNGSDWESEPEGFEKRGKRQAGVLDNGSDWESEPEGLINILRRKKRQAFVENSKRDWLSDLDGIKDAILDKKHIME